MTSINNYHLVCYMERGITFEECLLNLGIQITEKNRQVLRDSLSTWDVMIDSSDEETTRFIQDILGQLTAQ